MRITRATPFRNRSTTASASAAEVVAATAEDPVGGHLVEGAEEHLGRERRVDAGAEHAAPLAFGDHVADDAEVFAQLGGGEPLHELRGLPQLDLEDDGEVAVAAEALEVQAGDAAEPLDGVVEPVEHGPSLGEPFAHGPLEDRDEQVVLAAEVEVDRAGGDARGARDVGHLGVEEPAAGEDRDGRPEDGFALVAASGGTAAFHGSGTTGTPGRTHGWGRRQKRLQ